MAESAGSGTGVAPLVTIVDPLTWTHEWSYDIERNLLEERGIEFVVPADEAERDRLASRADVVISSSEIPVDEAMINRLDNCVGIVCYGSGMDAVDAAAAKRRSIAVTNIQANAVEVADHAMTLLLALVRRLPELSKAAASGEWDLRNLPEAWLIPRLSDLKVGIVGVGRVGRRVAHLAQAFGMTTIGHYRTPPDPEDPSIPHMELGELAASCDALIVCASLNEESKNMINREVLAGVKRGAVLVNVGRGGLVDEQALLAALEDGRLSQVGLDVRVSEPPEPGDPLSGRPDVLQTPHQAGLSAGSLVALHEVAAAQAIRLLEESGRLS